MKSFLDDRQNVASCANGKGKVTKGSQFQPISTGIRTSKMSGAGTASAGDATAEVVQNQDGDPNAPKVEFIRDGDIVRQIVVTFGDQKVEIDCQY